MKKKTTKKKTKKPVPKIIGIASSPIIDGMGPMVPMLERMYLFNDGRVITEIGTPYGTRDMKSQTGADILKKFNEVAKANRDVEEIRKASTTEAITRRGKEILEADN